ncbi:MAG: hypothetical protein ACP5G7_06500 [Anaerolineae bacterium]
MMSYPTLGNIFFCLYENASLALASMLGDDHDTLPETLELQEALFLLGLAGCPLEVADTAACIAPEL